MDLRYALRSLRKNPGFALLAVLVMGSGIGANTAVFSVVNTVLLKPLEYHDPDRIVAIANQWRNGSLQATVSAPDFHDWHDQTTAFASLAYYIPNETVVKAGSSAEYVRVAGATPEFFGVFDAQPVVGRLFSPEEQQPGSNGAAVVSYAFWQSHYEGKPAVLGQVVRLQDKALTIVGVMPPRFEFPGKTELWFPANTIFAETTSRSSHNYLVVGRLKPGVLLEEARGQMTALAARLEQAYPPSNKNKGVSVTRLSDDMVGDVRTTLYLLLGAVAMVLLIACANVANLLLAKATARTREMAIRSAVGASRGRIVRQLLTESLVLAGLSGVVGLLLAVWGANALVLLAPQNVPRLAETAIDGWVLAFTFGTSAAACLLFGLAPALHASRVDLSDALTRGAARSVVGGAGRMRAMLVVAEIALSVMLLMGAGLLLKSFSALARVSLGYRPEHVAVMSASVPATSVESARRATRFYKDLLAQVSALPGVTSASASRMPPGRVLSNGAYWVDHAPRPEELNVGAAQAVFSIVARGAFSTLGIPVRDGRDFEEGDGFDAPLTAVVNESLVRKSFGGQNPMGRSIYVGFDSPSPRELRIVGVVGDVRQAGPARPPSPEIYMPYPQHPGAGVSMSVLVRTTGDPAALFETLRRKAREVSPEVPVKFSTMESRLAENVATPRFRTLLFAIFAGLAVCLAMAGVYGVMAYAVGQRTSELGLRMALGASPGDVLRLVLRQGLTLAGMGLVTGLAGAAASNRLLAKLLFEVKPSDGLTYAVVTVLLSVVALAAIYIPARRATQVDPLMALRQE